MRCCRRVEGVEIVAVDQAWKDGGSEGAEEERRGPQYVHVEVL